jgi:hypothetical protein
MEPGIIRVWYRRLVVSHLSSSRERLAVFLLGDGTMKCVNCGHENPAKALVCFWCGLDPATGETPYPALGAPAVEFWEELMVPEVVLPPPIEVPSMTPDHVGAQSLDLTMPELPTIDVAPPPDVPDEQQFTVVRRRARHKPVVHISSIAPPVMHALLPIVGRLLVFVGGLLLIITLVLALLAAVGAASFGGAFCLIGLLGLGTMLWVALLAARAGKRIVEETGEMYERLEVLGKVLREVAPGLVEEFPVNLPARSEVLDQPVAYSELRALAGEEDEPPTDLAEDLLTGAITSLVARDDVILARRYYPVKVQGALTRASATEVNQPVLRRRKAYVGPGELEERVAGALRTDRSMTVAELIGTLLGPEGRQRTQHLIAAVNDALGERPPDLDALASPEDALAEFKRYRETVRRADPELYQMLEEEVRRGLAAVMRRPIPSSLMDLARLASDVVDQPRSPQP